MQASTDLDLAPVDLPFLLLFLVGQERLFPGPPVCVRAGVCVVGGWPVGYVVRWVVTARWESVVGWVVELRGRGHVPCAKIHGCPALVRC